jgi:cell division protein FtsQ
MKKLKFKSSFLVFMGWFLALSGFLILLGFAGNKKNNRMALGLRVTIQNINNNYFIEPADIESLLNARGRELKGKPMHDINIPMLEKIIYTNPYIDKAEVYSTIDGYVNIDVVQRNPLIRIINTENEHYYVDEKGEFIPVSEKFSKPVVVANGYIYDRYSLQNLDYSAPVPGNDNVKPVMVQLVEVAKFLNTNEFWNDQIEQIYVNEKAELELIPRVGGHNILIGTSEDLDLKLQNLMVFYQQGASKVGWNNYSTINLKYIDQVVCTKVK